MNLESMNECIENVKEYHRTKTNGFNPVNALRFHAGGDLHHLYPAICRNEGLLCRGEYVSHFEWDDVADAYSEANPVDHTICFVPGRPVWVKNKNNMCWEPAIALMLTDSLERQFEAIVGNPISYRLFSQVSYVQPENSKRHIDVNLWPMGVKS